ncbi:MAG: hypothetical protein RL300_1268 [Pseudomonadota bacterium]
MLESLAGNRRIDGKQEKGQRPSLSCVNKTDRNEGRASPP